MKLDLLSEVVLFKRILFIIYFENDKLLKSTYS